MSLRTTKTEGIGRVYAAVAAGEELCRRSGRSLGYRTFRHIDLSRQSYRVYLQTEETIMVRIFPTWQKFIKIDR